MPNGIGDRFQKETKYHRGRMPGGSLFWSAQPEPYKEYPDKKKVELPPPEMTGKTPLDEAIKRRKSVRDFANKAITKEDLSFLLWSSNGIGRKEHGYEFRTAPSAGALYPVETAIPQDSSPLCWSE